MSTDHRLQCRRPTGVGKIPKELQTGDASPDVDSEEVEGKARKAGENGGKHTRQGSNKRRFRVTVTNVSEDGTTKQKEDWYPGKERDDIPSDDDYFLDDKYPGLPVLQQSICGGVRYVSPREGENDGESSNSISEGGWIGHGAKIGAHSNDYDRPDLFE